MSTGPAQGQGQADVRGVDDKRGTGSKGKMHADGLGISFEDIFTYVGQFLKAILKAGKHDSAVVWKSEAEKKFQVIDLGKLSSLWDNSQEKKDLKEEEIDQNGGVQDSPEGAEGDDHSLEEMIRCACENGFLEKVADDGEHIYIFE